MWCLLGALLPADTPKQAPDAPVAHRQVYDAACELDERPFAAAAGAGAGASAGATPAALPGLLPGGTPPTLTRCTVGTPVRGMGCAPCKTLEPVAQPAAGRHACYPHALNHVHAHARHGASPACHTSG